MPGYDPRLSVWGPAYSYWGLAFFLQGALLLSFAGHSFCRLPLRLPDTPFGGRRSTPLPFADIPALAIAPASLCKRTYGDCTQGWPNKV